MISPASANNSQRWKFIQQESIVLFPTHQPLCHVGHSIKNTSTRSICSTIGIWHLYIYIRFKHALPESSHVAGFICLVWCNIDSTTCMHITCRWKSLLPGCAYMYAVCAGLENIASQASFTRFHYYYEGQANMWRANVNKKSLLYVDILYFC